MNTVLIVEDEKMIRQGIKAMIQRSGVPVQNIMECNNGQIALEILGSQKIDVMFTDIRMPKMDGIELVEAMQKLEHRPLTVAISGYDDFTYAVRLLRMGVKEYILKPVEREQIVEILKKLEEEIQRNNENDKEIREIGCQQLKYMILNEYITEKEIQTVTQRFEKQLLSKEYVVCCLENSGERTDENTCFLYLGDIEANCVYIIGRENKEFLLKNELADSYVGVSRLHSGVAQLKTAYEEARTARKEAFL
ncbi:MAG: response regulator, partial [Lachnospiraceae bacterium]|nr:response regulator [Lachnospiraceae bacterium]